MAGTLPDVEWLELTADHSARPQQLVISGVLAILALIRAMLAISQI